MQKSEIFLRLLHLEQNFVLGSTGFVTVQPIQNLDYVNITDATACKSFISSRSFVQNLDF
jgi:hypothetical protein